MTAGRHDAWNPRRKVHRERFGYGGFPLGMLGDLNPSHTSPPGETLPETTIDYEGHQLVFPPASAVAAAPEGDGGDGSQ